MIGSKSTFEDELQTLINRHGIENNSDTPDFILAKYLQGCLDNFNNIIKARDKWYDFKPWNYSKNLDEPNNEPREPIQENPS